MPFILCRSEEELESGLTSKMGGGPLGRKSFLSWTLSSLKLNHGQAWLSQDCSHCVSPVHRILSLEVIRRWAGSVFTAFCGRAGGQSTAHLEKPLSLLLSFLSDRSASEIPLLRISQCFSSMATLHHPGVVSSVD